MSDDYSGYIDWECPHLQHTLWGRAVFGLLQAMAPGFVNVVWPKVLEGGSPDRVMAVWSPAESTAASLLVSKGAARAFYQVHRQEDMQVEWWCLEGGGCHERTCGIPWRIYPASRYGVFSVQLRQLTATGWGKDLIRRLLDNATENADDQEAYRDEMLRELRDDTTRGEILATVVGPPFPPGDDLLVSAAV